MLAASRLKRPSLVVYERENEVVNFVLSHSELTPDKEILDGMKNLSKEDLARCLRCKKSSILDIITQYSQDISCSGCVRTIRASLEQEFPKQGLMHALFTQVDGHLEIRPKFQELGVHEIGKVFAAFNNCSYFSRKSNGKRQRCSLHTAHPRIDEDWLQIWEEMPDHLKEKVVRMDVEELSDALMTHLKDLYFCRDCRGNVLRALDLLVGYLDVGDLPMDDEFCEEYFLPFQLSTQDCDEDEDDPENPMYDAGEYKSGDEDSFGDIDDVDSLPQIDISEYDIKTADGEKKLTNNLSSYFSDDSDQSPGCSGKRPKSKRRRGPKHRRYHTSEHNVSAHGHGHCHDVGNSQGRGTEQAFKSFWDENDNEDDDSGSEFGLGSDVVTHVICALYEVPTLIRKAIEADERDEASRANGQNSDRHAPTLKDGQSELLHCIGKFMLNRIKDSWILQLVRAQTDELLVWLTLSCIRFNVQSAAQTGFGSQAIISLLEEEDRKREALNKKKNKKKQKKKNKKKNKKKKAGEKALENSEAVERPQSQPLEEDSQSKPPSPASANDHGWSEDSEARLLAQLCGQLSPSGGGDDTSVGEFHDKEESSSPNIEVFDQSEDRFLSTMGIDLSMQEGDMNEFGQDEEALTDEEIREAQKKLKEMMAKSSRAQLRANLREKFDNLCLKTS
uniref:Gametogenetin-binding protein 2 n=1 Tax=Mucochytrium quahogii TaxID=96639 RepID=A0A7S2SKJ5_9STRA|mmetsp:Transcript_22746/g.36274  ORF Transcript_22746/g.36274 Transcript_22746/m.36274 type:complete len:674 (+) Transcript_22746:285-2306(+)